MYNILLNGVIWNNLSQSKLVLKNTTVFELWAGTWKGKTYAHTHTYCIARATVRHRQTWLNPEDLIYQMSHQASKWYHQKITKVTFSFPALLSPSLHSFGFIISFRWCYDDLSNSFDRPRAFVYHFSTNTAPQFFLPFFFKTKPYIRFNWIQLILLRDVRLRSDYADKQVLPYETSRAGTTRTSRIATPISKSSSSHLP